MSRRLVLAALAAPTIAAAKAIASTSVARANFQNKSGGAISLSGQSAADVRSSHSSGGVATGRDNRKFVALAAGRGVLTGFYKKSASTTEPIFGSRFVGVSGIDAAAAIKQEKLVQAGVNDLQGRVSRAAAANKNRPDEYYGRILQRYERMVSYKMREYYKNKGHSADVIRDKTPHFWSRHGSQTSRFEQLARANYRRIPGSEPVRFEENFNSATRFLSHKNQYDAIKMALKERDSRIARNEINPFEPYEGPSERQWGEGYRKKETSIMPANRFIVKFDEETGLPFTSFAVIR